MRKEDLEKIISWFEKKILILGDLPHSTDLNEDIQRLVQFKKELESLR